MLRTHYSRLGRTNFARITEKQQMRCSEISARSTRSQLFQQRGSRGITGHDMIYSSKHTRIKEERKLVSREPRREVSCFDLYVKLASSFQVRIQETLDSGLFQAAPRSRKRLILIVERCPSKMAMIKRNIYSLGIRSTETMEKH